MARSRPTWTLIPRPHVQAGRLSQFIDKGVYVVGRVPTKPAKTLHDLPVFVFDGIVSKHYWHDSRGISATSKSPTYLVHVLTMDQPSGPFQSRQKSRRHAPPTWWPEHRRARFYAKQRRVNNGWVKRGLHEQQPTLKSNHMLIGGGAMRIIEKVLNGKCTHAVYFPRVVEHGQIDISKIGVLSAHFSRGGVLVPWL